MFNHKDVNDVPKPTVDGTKTNIERNGFALYEEKYHKGHTFEGQSIESDEAKTLTPKILENIFVYDVKELHEICKHIDKYLEDRVLAIDNIEHANIDDLFCEDDFVEIIKP